MDRRIQKTRDSIFEAFTSLLSQKTYSKITVQEIIDEANIGRSTFYSHFETKDDLLKALSTNIFNHIFSEDLDSETTHDFSEKENLLNNKIAHVFYHLRDSKRDIKTIFKDEAEDIFLSSFKMYLEKMFENHISFYGLDNVPRYYLFNHVITSFINTVKWWINTDMIESPEDMAEYFLNVVPFLIK